MTEPRSFDPEQSWAPLEARIAEERDPRRLLLLERVRDHMLHEIRGELDELMATLVGEPRYHIWGLPVEAGPKGREAVEHFYREMIAGGGNHFHFAIERIVVDHDAVITEGEMRQRVAGSALLAAGVERVEDEPVDVDASYLSLGQIITVWPAAEDGRLIGEDIYMGSPMFAHFVRLAD